MPARVANPRAMRFASVFLFLLLTACGPDFAGNYTGGVTITGSCSDGSGGVDTLTTEWTIADSGDELTIIPGGNCGNLTASVDGNLAEIRQKTCPAHTGASGNTTTETVTGGTLALKGDALSVSVDTNAQITGPSGAGTCRYLTAGTLGRK